MAEVILRDYVADLHVHTLLSPCAEVEMIPPLIVREAQARGIDIIAIADHNASANVAAVQRAAEESGLIVLPGMELQTYEEVHLLCLFDTLAQLAAWQEVVDASLPDLPNRPDFFGEQFVVDETGEFIRREPRLLTASVSLRFERAVAGVRQRGGLAIAAHVDRPTYSLFAALGFIPPHARLDALEISRFITPEAARRKFPVLAGLPLICGSDAHRLDELTGATTFTLAAPSVAEIRLALRGQAGRSCKIVVAAE